MGFESAQGALEFGVGVDEGEQAACGKTGQAVGVGIFHVHLCMGRIHLSTCRATLVPRNTASPRFRSSRRIRQKVGTGPANRGLRLPQTGSDSATRLASASPVSTGFADPTVGNSD